MSDPADQPRVHGLQEQETGALAAERLYELREQPLPGNFDLEHLKAIHAYIFQDAPEHQPGVLRERTEDAWIKNRALENQHGGYQVHYANSDIAAKIATALDGFGGPATIQGLDAGEAGKRIALLYANLDYAHGFHEGNSRTLREFTRELADAAGHTLSWDASGADANERNRLYIARDLEVMHQAFPDLTPERAMQTTDRAEYEASLVIDGLSRNVGANTLEAIITRSLDVPGPDRLQTQAAPPAPSPKPDRQPGEDTEASARIERANILETGDTARANTHPDLAAAFAQVARLDLILAEGHVEDGDRTRVVQALRGELAFDLTNGVPIEKPVLRELGDRPDADEIAQAVVSKFEESGRLVREILTLESIYDFQGPESPAAMPATDIDRQAPSVTGTTPAVPSKPDIDIGR